jgi:hypothetical protein
MVFTTVGGSSLSINITAENMANEYAGNYMASANDNLTVQLNTDGNDAMCCTYNVSWEWIEDSNPLNQYSKSNTQDDEFTLTGATSGTAGTYNFTNQLPNYNASSRTNAIYTGAQICNKNNGVTSASVSQIWNFTNTFYNLNVNQDAFKGASFKGKVRITDVSCTKGEPISFSIGSSSFNAMENMTWQEWVNSPYNTDGYKIMNNKIYTSDESYYINVLPTAEINTSGSYNLISNTISFYINSEQLTSQEGMTFQQWFNSDYNIHNWSYNGGTSFSINYSTEALCVPNGGKYTLATGDTFITANTYYRTDVDFFCKL